jgi:hypothetical protein
MGVVLVGYDPRPRGYEVTEDGIEIAPIEAGACSPGYKRHHYLDMYLMDEEGGEKDESESEFEWEGEFEEDLGDFVYPGEKGNSSFNDKDDAEQELTDLALAYVRVERITTAVSEGPPGAFQQYT